jgi:hypothetical protein
LRQEEALLIGSMNEENKHGSASMVNSVTGKAESKSTCAESNESKEASFIQQEHGKLSKTTVHDFSGRKGVYLLPYEFRAKEVDDHQGIENIAEQCSVDREQQSEEKSHRIHNSKKTRRWRIIKWRSKVLFRSYNYHTLQTSSKRYIQQIIYLFSDWVKTILLMHLLAKFS